MAQNENNPLKADARMVGKKLNNLPEDIVLAWAILDQNEVCEKIANQLKGYSFKIYSENQYRLLMNLLTFAGANVWDWHKGYKSHSEEDHNREYTVYSWGEHGILKELYPVIPEEDEKTIEEIFSIINSILVE